MKLTKPYVIGIIGGSGTGKTYFANYMTSSLQGVFIEGDRIGREAIVLPKVIEAIGETFGQGLINKDGQIDRKSLGSIVFGHRDKLDQLNAIIHPVMYAIIEERLKSTKAPIVILEAAVMIEAGFDALVDSMWYIKADEDVRLKRLVDDRGIEEEKARNMIASGRKDYRDYSDYIIDATWGLEVIQDELDRLLDGIREISNE